MLFFKKKKSTEDVNQENTTLEKSKICLDKTIINLKKEINFDFENLKSEVCFVIDFSGSMDYDYAEGRVDKLIQKIFPIALKFDNDKKMESYIFSDNCKKLEDITEKNYKDYGIKIYNKFNHFYMCGTCYSKPLEKLHKTGTKHLPKFVIFITDGDNADEYETNEIIKTMSNDNIFIMFIGIGDSNFEYLKKLDTLKDRPIDNTGFCKAVDIYNGDTEQLYKIILTEYSKWLKLKNNQ